MSTPKSLLNGRTQDQFDFDLGIKGWAFMHESQLKKNLPRYRALYDAIGFEDKKRHDLLLSIEGASEGIPL